MGPPNQAPKSGTFIVAYEEVWGWDMRDIGTFGAALGYALWVWALERTTPTRVAVCLALNPLIAAGLSAVFLHEPLNGRFLLGFAFVSIGIIATNHRAASA